MSSSSTAVPGAEEREKTSPPAKPPAGMGMLGHGLSNGNLVGITVSLWTNVFKSYGKTIMTFFLTFLVSGWALRQLASFFPFVERMVYSGGLPDPPPAELFAIWLVQMALRLALNGVCGLVALAVIAFALFVWNWTGSMGSTPDLSKFYGEGSWAAVVTQPGDPLGIAFCHELAAAKLNLLVISEGGMRDLCATLQQTSGVQVQPFEMSLSDIPRVARAWESYDLGVVVFVVPRASQTSEAEKFFEQIESVFTAGVLGAQQASAAAMPKLLGRAGEGKKASLVFTTSMCGLYPVPGRTAQSVVDSAVVTLASSLAVELLPKGVNVLNAPCRGLRDHQDSTTAMRCVARPVLVGLSKGWKIAYGSWRNAAQAWTIGALPLSARQWLLEHLSRSMSKVKQKRDAKSQVKESEDAGDDGTKKQQELD